MKYRITFLAVFLSFLSCQQDEKVLTLEEQFFGDQEIIVLNNFLSQMDEAVCPNNLDKSYNCFNDFLCKVYSDIDSGGHWGRPGIELVKNMTPLEFSALFVYYKGFRQKSFFHEKVERDVLNINENFAAFIKAYHKTAESEHLKFLMERSSWFTNFGPSAQAHFLTKCDEFDFSNDRDRFLFYLTYVILSNNLTHDL